MIFRQMQIGAMMNFTYIVGDEKTRLAAVVDPHGEVDRIIETAKEAGLKIAYVINTHSHWDHVAGNDELASKTGAKVIMHASSRLKKDRAVNDGDVINVGETPIRTLHTPGHSPDEMCLLVEGKLLTGDTLFVGECGRTDLPGSSPEDMYDSLFNKILKLDDAVEVYPGHDYGPSPSSTVGHERRYNYTLKPRAKSEFVKFMAEG
ncbi:MAG: MBL fold metallo-hydrolase [Candidatus Bathyarchaeia archaeon]